MQLIVLPGSGRGSRMITKGQWVLSLLVLLGLCVFGVGIYLGYRYAGQTGFVARKTDGADRYYQDLLDEMRAQQVRQQAEIAHIKEGAALELEALAIKLSGIHGQVLRLEALGTRLAYMADIDDIDFGADTPVGLGGPSPEADPVVRLQASDFMQELELLGERIEDHDGKLHAIEALIMERDIKDRTVPAGSPVPGGWISSYYGMRTDPFTGQREFHQGLDISGRHGTQVHAVAPGFVSWSGYRLGYGNVVEINHGGGYRTSYAHNKKNLVRIGDWVEKGQSIALLGSTGRSTGSHVHFEVSLDNKPVNPRKYISQLR